MIGRERRERVRREYSPRSEGRNVAPPSRHLWVGNLSHHINENELSEHCLRFGELDNIVFPPGRSYAFVNYRKEEDAILAMRALQGFVIAGLPLKIEFAKAERSLPSSHDDYQQRREERRSVEHGTQFQRDSRARLVSPEKVHTEKSRMGDKNAEPSEVLWIGFPLFLNVDEILLRRSFSPFGEIEKITAFPGRSYAFVQFRTVAAACRAKEALQGKLFDNPRVSICFAKSEMNSHEQARNLINPPFSPDFKPNGHPGRPSEFRQDRKFGNSTGEPYRGSPRFNPDFEFGDSGSVGFGRKAPVWTVASGTFEPMSLQGPRTQRGFSQDICKRENSPARERGPQRHDFSPGRLPRKIPYHEDPSGMQDSFFSHEAKKLKTGPFPSDRELPEYPFSDSAHENQYTGLSKTFPNLPEHGTFNRSFGSGPFSNNRIGDRPMNFSHPLEERNDNRNAPYDRFETGPGPLPTNPVKWKISSPESHQSPVKEEWKWEGTIAKGGTPVCRARCFPVGKVVDVMLPGFLNCTARTGLDMLAKHFYQAASSWVVFFVPESDADIALYNEFMHYLGEKQRAAVAKLGEKTTLFLVPPSDFSEKVLKVPGKLSISGVILRFQDLNSDFVSLDQPLEAMDSKLPSFHEDISHMMPPSTDIRPSSRGPSQSYTNFPPETLPSSTAFAAPRKSEVDLPIVRNLTTSTSSASLSGSAHLTGRVSEAPNDSRYYQLHRHQHPQSPSNWSHHHMQNSNAAVYSSDTITKPGTAQEASSSRFAPGISDTPLPGREEIKPQVPKIAPLPPVPDQLTNFLSLLVQKQNPGNDSVLSLEEGDRQSGLVKSENSFQSSQSFGQGQSNFPPVSQTSSQDLQPQAPQSQVNQPLPTTAAREEEANPHTRLQATLQLAAALLQQIQQQSKATDQR